MGKVEVETRLSRWNSHGSNSGNLCGSGLLVVLVTNGKMESEFTEVHEVHEVHNQIAGLL